MDETVDGERRPSGRAKSRISRRRARAAAPTSTSATSPMLRARGRGDLLMVGQKSGNAWALDPDKEGAIVWQHKVGKGSWDGGLVGDPQPIPPTHTSRTSTPTSAPPKPAVSRPWRSYPARVWFTKLPEMKCGHDATANPVQGQSAAITAIPGVVFSSMTTDHARVSHQRWIDHLGVRQRQTDRDRERRRSERRINRRPRSHRQPAACCSSTRLLDARRTHRATCCSRSACNERRGPPGAGRRRRARARAAISRRKPALPIRRAAASAI